MENNEISVLGDNKSYAPDSVNSEPEKNNASLHSSWTSDSGNEDGGADLEMIPYYKLFSFADSLDVTLMIVGTICAVANGLAMPIMTVLFGNMIQSFGSNSDIDALFNAVVKVSLEFVYLAIATGAVSSLQVICWTITGEKQASRIRSLYLKTILRQEIAFFDKDTNTGEIVGRMSCDTLLIQEAMGEKVAKFIQLLSTFFGGFVVAFVKGWMLTLVMTATIPPLVASAALLATIVGKMATRGQLAYAEAANIVEQTVSSIRTVVSFTSENKAVDKYKESLKKAASANVYEGFSTGLGLGVVMFVMFCGYSLGIWYGGQLIINHGYTGGKVINVIFAVLTASFSLGQASPCLSAFAAGRAAGYKMFEIIDRKPAIDSFENSERMVDDIHGDIELRNVVFSYPTRPNERIFAGFSLSIKRGECVALVGESGSGKSTIISLIERFYDPQSGEVLIDGINLKEFQLRWIRKQIGLVSQEPILFSSSIRDNISYGKDDATLEDIEGASELANASEFINKMPQGYDTMVGEHGTQLSGGQKQRIALARAILKNPKILLLDEATSALDVESEKIVQAALERGMVHRTTVIVAHRLSTVKNADTIAVIHRGSIVEKGPHSELIEDHNGAYSQLIRLQEINHDTSSMENNNSTDSMERQTSHKSSVSNDSSQWNISRDSSMGNSYKKHSFSRSLSLPMGSFGNFELKRLDIKTQDQTQMPQQVSIMRLASFNKPEIPILILGTIAAIIDGLVLPIFGFLLSSIINAFYKTPSRLQRELNFWALMFMLCGLEAIFVMPVKSYLFAIAGTHLVKRIRSMCFEKVVHMEVSWFDNPENSSGAIGARLSTDAAAVKGLVGDYLAMIVQNTTSIVAGLLIAFTASWQLSLIIFALIPLMGLNGYIQMKYLKGSGEETKMIYEEASQVANDAVGNIRTVASFTAEETVLKLYMKKCEVPLKSGIREGVISGIGFGASFFLLFCAYATIFYSGAQLMKQGLVTFDDIFRVLFVLLMAAMGISQTSSLGPDVTKAKSASTSIFSILDRKSKIDSNDNSGTVLEQVRGNILFQHVKFTYPTRPNVPIFQDLTFTADSGKVIALVGESGSGKSTVISLLQRFFDPDSGHILLDGVDIKDLKLRWFRQQMGLVSQEPVLFNDTIRANIAYGKEDEIAESDIIASAESANASRFIDGLQQGYDTIVGERGIQLSGGQKQRVAIARAILKNPKILLLDEATSALDAESERIVQDALEKMMLNRTTIVVAHRLSTIRGADTIAVVKNGSIVEKGSHDSLINVKGGAYASLVALHDGVASTSA